MLKGTKSASGQSRGGANECSDASRAELEAFAASASEQIAALQARVRELEDLSERDELTGLTNRRGLKTYLRRATSRSTRSGREGVVAFFDLDGFKQINDRFGHDAGDTALRVVAEVLRGGVRASDAVARLGGDEFVVVLENVGAEDGRARLECLRAEIESRAVVARGERVGLRASFGWSTFGRGRDALRALTMADEEMYGEKSRRTQQRQAA